MEVSVDTYIGRRNTDRYTSLLQQDVEVLVANDIAPHLKSLELDCKKFLFMNRIRALLEMRGGYIISD